ncbi:MAG: SOS response-associated peptidase [Alphaproteobacteria bacterium]
MCGRIQITNPVEAISNLFDDLDVSDYTSGQADWPYSFNISPSAFLPLIVQSAHGLSLKAAHWGFIPSWAKDKKFAANSINARLETAFEKPYYKSAIRQRRALLPVTAYYEWKTIAGAKQPFRFHLPNLQPMYFACIWEDWINPQIRTPMTSFAILTTEADQQAFPLINQVNHRMPLLLSPSVRRNWLANGVESFRGQLNKDIIENTQLMVHPVSKQLNKAVNQGPELAEPINLSDIKHETAYARTHSDQGDLFN